MGKPGNSTWVMTHGLLSKSMVECYAGSTYPERPLSFTWHGTHYEVCDIIDRRRQPAGIGFLVRCTPGNALFDLFYNETKDQWQIQLKGSTVINENPHQSSVTQGD